MRLVSDKDTSQVTCTTKRAGNGRKISLQTTAENLQGRRRRDVTWRGSSFQKRAITTVNARSPASRTVGRIRISAYRPHNDDSENWEDRLVIANRRFTNGKNMDPSTDPWGAPRV